MLRETRKTNTASTLQALRESHSVKPSETVEEAEESTQTPDIEALSKVREGVLNTVDAATKPLEGEVREASLFSGDSSMEQVLDESETPPPRKGMTPERREAILESLGVSTEADSETIE